MNRRGFVGSLLGGASLAVLMRADPADAQLMLTGVGPGGSGVSNPAPLYDFDVSVAGHYTNSGGKLSANTNQGTFTGGMAQPTVANQQTLTTGASGQFAIGNGSTTVIAYNNIAAFPQTSTVQLPDGRGGGNDPARSVYPNWAVGTTYPARATPGFVVSLVDGNSYFSLQAGNIGHEPSVSPTFWALINKSGFSTTHLHLNLAKGSGYVVGNDGRQCQGDGTANWPGAVFITDAGTKDTAYGNGTGSYTGEFILPLPAYSGISVQTAAINPNDTGYLWLALEFVGIEEWNYTSGVQRGTTLIVDGLTDLNGLCVVGDGDPLGDGTYFFTNGSTGAGPATISKRRKDGTLISSRNVGFASDGMFWHAASKSVFVMANATAMSFTGVGLLPNGSYPAETGVGGAPINWSSANANVPTTFNRGEGVCIGWDGKLRTTHNGPFHQSGTPTAVPNYGLLAVNTTDVSALGPSTPCLDVFIRCSSTTWTPSKTLIQGGDPVGVDGGWGIWQDSTASNNLRVYASAYGTAQMALFNTGTITTASFPAGKVIQVSFNGVAKSVSVYLDNVLISTDTTSFTDFIAAQCIQTGMLAIGGNPLSSTARNSTINWKGVRIFATATGISSTLQAATVAYLQGLA